MNVRAADWPVAPPDPDEAVPCPTPYPFTLPEIGALKQLVRELGFEYRGSDLMIPGGTRIMQVRRWTYDVVMSVVQCAKREQHLVYLAVRRALRACVDPEFRKAFWAARLLGGYEAGGAYLLANAPTRRVNRTAKDTRAALDAAWRLHDPEALQPIINMLNALAPGASVNINGCIVRRGKPGGAEHRYWIASPYMERELALPGEPRRLLRPLWEAAILATMGAERPRSKRRR